jgi:heterodisulfide reductase subunit C2
MIAATIEIEDIGGALAQEVQTRSGATPMSCYQCAKCSSGCPVAARGGLKPHELVRMVQLDQRDVVLSSGFIWECTSCQICITRCPQQVDIAAMNDALRAISLAAGKVAPGTAAPAFNDIFLKGIRKRGRVYELGLMAEFKLRTGRLLEDAGKAPMMFSKGKLPLLPHSVTGRAQRKAMFRRAAQGGAQ